MFHLQYTTNTPAVFTTTTASLPILPAFRTNPLHTVTSTSRQQHKNAPIRSYLSGCQTRAKSIQRIIILFRICNIPEWNTTEFALSPTLLNLYHLLTLLDITITFFHHSRKSDCTTQPTIHPSINHQES